MSKTLQEIRQQMKRLVEDVNEGGYNQIIELCYADWGDWDGHDDSTEPEEPIYIDISLHQYLLNYLQESKLLDDVALVDSLEQITQNVIHYDMDILSNLKYLHLQ